MALFGNFFKDKPEQFLKQSNLRPGAQENLFSQYQSSLQAPGAGGAFGESADYYRNLLSGGGSDQFEAPLQRQFKEDILPGIAEQFAGLGAGGLSSSGFAQETGRASTDLAERLGAMRAALRQQGAEGLTNLASGGLTPVDQQVFRPRQPSAFESFATGVAPGIGTGIGLAAGGPLSSLFSSKKFLQS